MPRKIRTFLYFPVTELLQWTHLQLISFAIAPVVLLLVLLLKNDDWGAIANESTVRTNALCEKDCSRANNLEGGSESGQECSVLA